MRLRLCTCLAFAFALSAAFSSAWAVSPTGCDEASFLPGFYQSGDQRVFDPDRFHAYAISLDVPIFTDAAGDARNTQTLRFSERLSVIDPGAGKPRMKVRTSGGLTGWVDRNSAMCRTAPLADSTTGLFRRAVVRTESEVQGQRHVKKIYHAPDRRCEGDCPEVSRFRWYYVYAEDPNFYLLSESAQIGNVNTKLLGWLPKEDAFDWNTSLGLRANREVGMPNGAPPVCLYPTRNDLRANTHCNQIIGGMRWFDLEVRIAVRSQDSEAYDVIFSSAFQDASAPQVADQSKGIEGLKNIDVFFIIDGTKSMGPAIAGVKKLTNLLKDKLKAKLTAGGVIRYGFQVYRDTTKGGGDGVSTSEHLALKDTDCQKTNEDEFNRAFSVVKAVDSPGDDDFPENTFGGMLASGEEFAACPDHQKIVFIMGDAGYDAAKQQSRDKAVITEEQVAKRFRKCKDESDPNCNSRLGTQGTLPEVVFIRTAREDQGVDSRDRYISAYDLFETQARSIQQKIYAGTSTHDPLFTTLAGRNPDEDVANSILAPISQHISQEAIAVLGEGQRMGESLERTIDRLRHDDKLNVPIRFLDTAFESLCQRYGPQCHSDIYEGVHTGFIKTSELVTPEVLITNEQLRRWMEVLDKFRSFGNSISGRPARRELANTLVNDLEGILQTDIPNDSRPMDLILQFRAGIPISSKTKLLIYSPVELTDDAAVPGCEIDYLVQYAARKQDVLKLVTENHGEKLVEFHEGRWPEGGCPNITDKGKTIPFIAGDIRPRSMQENGRFYHYFYQRDNDQFFWLPVDYLP